MCDMAHISGLTAAKECASLFYYCDIVTSTTYKSLGVLGEVKKNAQALANALLRRKCRLVAGGTDNHLLLWDLTALGLTGRNYEKVCEMCHIFLIKLLYLVIMVLFLLEE